MKLTTTHLLKYHFKDKHVVSLFDLIQFIEEEFNVIVHIGEPEADAEKPHL